MNSEIYNMRIRSDVNLIFKKDILLSLRKNNLERWILMIYCISDVHGDFIRYRTMLKMINFSDKDTLYVLGDVIDHGNESMKILFDMMNRANVIPILGNHEYMARKCLPWFSKDIALKPFGEMSPKEFAMFKNWILNGGNATLEEYRKLSIEKQKKVLDYISGFSLYKEVSVGGKNFVLVHAGINNFDENKNMEDYQHHELIFHRPDYSKVYFKDKYLVTGHTPTWLIRDKLEGVSLDLIYIHNKHIAIDCGCGYGGLLGAIRLDDFEDFYD